MQRYFVKKDGIAENKITISGADVHHIRDVMRLRTGDRLVVCPNDGKAYACVIEKIEKTQVLATIESPLPTSLIPYDITIAQALIRKDRFELFLAKATELGVSRIIPTVFDRSIVKIGEEKATNKRQRYEAIVKEASEQSESDKMPLVEAFIPLREIDFSGFDKVFFCYERLTDAYSLKDVIPTLNSGQKLLFAIGPEGGISASEYAFLVEKGAIPLSLGKRILRSETAGMFVLSAFLYEWGAIDES